MPAKGQRYVTHSEACAILGVSPPSLRRRVAAGHLRLFVDPSDLRVRLIDQRELEEFMTPRPLGGDRPKAGGVAPLTAA